MCVPQLRAWGRRGWGPAGRGARAGKAGRVVPDRSGGLEGAGCGRGGSCGVREWRERPPGRTSPLSARPCSAPGPEPGGRCALTGAGTQAAHSEEVIHSGRGPRPLGRHPTRLTRLHHSGRDTHRPQGGFHTQRGRNAHTEPLTQRRTHAHTLLDTIRAKWSSHMNLFLLPSPISP